MASSSPLFTLPIPSLDPSSPPTGTFVCTEPSPKVYLLTFTAPPDNRLVTPFCQTFLLALDILETSYPPGVVVSTSSITKFYSNGLNLDHAVSTKGFWADSFFKLFIRLITYPMPTIALLNGHAFAGGFMLSMYHDYRIMNPTRGFLCMNELDFGAPLNPALLSIFEAKIQSPQVFRSIVLEAKRFPGPEALAEGIVDGLGGLDEVLRLVEGRKLVQRTATGVYGTMKREMYRGVVAILEKHGEWVRAQDAVGKREEVLGLERRKRVEEWERRGKGGAKL